MMMSQKYFTYNWKQHFLLLLFFGVVAISLLSPIASYKFFPSTSPDFAIHNGTIIQANQAISEGQFPIRIAPWQHHGLRYPLYQFYSNTPYTIGGAINYLIKNPFIVYKLLIWLALTLAGIYIYRLAHWFTRSSPAALLAGIVYMAAPYFIVNIIWRGDMAEACAQGILPIVLYYTLRFYIDSFNVRTFCLSALSWFILATTHLITFVYSSLFIGLFVLLLQLKNRHQWKNFIYTGVAYFYGCILALWFLAPIAVTEKYLRINNPQSLSSPAHANWLTSLSSLFSPVAASPLYRGLSLPIAIGWPILLSVVVVLYALFTKTIKKHGGNNQFISLLLLLFFLAFFMVWSPFNFWQILPRFLAIAQFSYRLLAQVMWIGALLSAWAILWIFKGKLEIRHVILSIFLIGLASGSWLKLSDSQKFISSTSVNKTPDLGYGKYDYLVSPKHISHAKVLNLNPLSLLYSDNWLILNKKISVHYDLIAKSPKLKLKLIGNIPSYAYDGTKQLVKLTVKANNHVIATKQFKSGNVSSWTIPVGKLIKPNHKEDITLEFSADKTFIPKQIDPNSTDRRLLAINVQTLYFTNLPHNYTVLPATNCQQKGAKKICYVDISKQATWIKLPVFYYPKLLNIKSNGKNVTYKPISYRQFILTAIKAHPGKQTISIYFRGLMWANWISTIGWIFLFLLLILDFLFTRKRKKPRHLPT